LHRPGVPEVRPSILSVSDVQTTPTMTAIFLHNFDLAHRWMGRKKSQKGQRSTECPGLISSLPMDLSASFLRGVTTGACREHIWPDNAMHTLTESCFLDAFVALEDSSYRETTEKRRYPLPLNGG
jgi:hypothetical protein